MAISDIVTDGELPEDIKKDLSAWADCVAGAWDARDYFSAIKEAEFSDVKIAPVYYDDDMIQDAVNQLDQFEPLNLNGKDLQKVIFSTKITAVKSK